MDTNGVRPKPTREERHRKRFAALAVELRRQHLTAAKALERYLAEEEADDAGTVAILPGHSAELPRSGNRPPQGMTADRAPNREIDRLMRQPPDPNGRLSRSR
jgi:hypothetical protein